jgi:protein-L-isoaspartate(D-aspartate) O-methyltransferase
MKNSIYIKLITCASIFYLFTSITFGLSNYSSGAAEFVLSENSISRIATDTTDPLSWHRPRFSERAKERQRLVEELEPRIENQEVLEAMRHVPRHHFIPEEYQSLAYENRPLPIGYKQTISQPFIVAYMTQLLNLQPGEKVLEIGTGSGYQAAVLSELTPEVYSIEIVAELAKQAKQKFEQLGYKTIKAKIGNGYKGWKTHAPFDAIILTAAPESIPDPLVNQLKPGGILVAPVGPAGQTQFLNLLIKSATGEVELKQVLPVRFVPMTGNDKQ